MSTALPIALLAALALAGQVALPLVTAPMAATTPSSHERNGLP